MVDSKVIDRGLAARIVEQSERHMWIEFMRHVPASTAINLGIEVREFGSAVGFAFKALPHWMMNRVLGLGYEQAATIGQIEDILEFYGSRELPIGISLIPHANPPEIIEWLQQKGFAQQNVWAKMYRDNSPIEQEASDFQIIELGEGDATRYSQVMCEGFEMPNHCVPVFAALDQVPGNHVYGVLDDGEMIAVSVLTVVDRIGHLNSMTTLKSHRGRGIQGALMAHHINEGISLGCNWFATETGLLPGQVNHSYNNMVRSGFQLAYERPNYVKQ